MRKSKNFIALILVLAIQFCTLTAAIVYKFTEEKQIEAKGLMVDFDLEEVFLHDTVIGFYIREHYPNNNYRCEYAIPKVDSDGNTILYYCLDKPKTSFYIDTKTDFGNSTIQVSKYKNLDYINLYKKSTLNEKDLYYFSDQTFDKATLRCWIYKGKAKIISITVDGKSVQEFFSELDKR